MAQINAVNELQPALADNDDFLKLFNDGIKPSEEYHGFSNKENTGFDHIDQMMKKSQKFYIEIGDYSLENQIKTLEFTYDRNE